MEISSAQLCDDILALTRKTKTSLFALAESHGLTPVQMFALYAVFRGEETMGRVACALHCDASNVTGIVDRLVAQDLLARSESAQDRRAKVLQLTTNGEKVMRDIISELPGQLGCAKLSSAERTALHHAISKLAA